MDDSPAADTAAIIAAHSAFNNENKLAARISWLWAHPKTTNRTDLKLLWEQQGVAQRVEDAKRKNSYVFFYDKLGLASVVV